ncbi:DUF4349 domain-containing protein [Streptosporangium sp. NPDC004631]
MSRLRYGLRLAAPLAGTALFLSACGGMAPQSVSDSGGAPAVAADSAEGTAYQGGGTAESVARAPGSTTAQAAGQTKLVPQDRAIVYRADMTVRAKDVAVAADRARGVVTTAGGYLATEKSQANSGGKGSASLVFKIPPAAYPGVLDRLGKELGTRESLQQDTEDVTEQVADVESRLKSAKASLDSLRTLMGKAKTIGEVLKVEREVSERESELESLQARQKTLTSQTSMATLTLNLIGPAVVVRKAKKEPSGFLGGLRTGWRAFGTAVKVGLTVLGVLTPWLIVVVPLWLLTAFVLRRRNRGSGDATRAASRPTPADSAETADAVGPGQGGGAADLGDPGQEDGADPSGRP